jgi:hypothetical protein
MLGVMTGIDQRCRDGRQAGHAFTDYTQFPTGMPRRRLDRRLARRHPRPQVSPEVDRVLNQTIDPEAEGGDHCRPARIEDAYGRS